MQAATVLPFIVVPLIGWRLYARFHRLTRRQAYSPARSWITVLLLPLLILLMAVGVLGGGDQLAFGALAAGVIGGVVLAHIGLRLTRFEIDNGVLHYTPNAKIGIALFALLVARLGYRLLSAWMAGNMDSFAGKQGGAAMLHSPLTLVVLGLVLAYYARYGAGILLAARRPPPAAT
jgi:hypothetical protein